MLTRACRKGWPRGGRLFVSMVLAWVCCALVSPFVSPAAGQAPEPAPTVTEVRIEQEGRTITDPALLALIETTPGEPLSMVDVRETRMHLTSLNRFEDVQPWTEPTPGGVRVVYRLIPLRPIDRLEFEGQLGLSEDTLRNAIREGLGTSLSANRIEPAKGVLRQVYRDKGYGAPRIDARLVPRSDPDRSTLVMSIDAGPRSILQDVRFESPDDNALIGLPDIRAGAPFDLASVQRTLDRYVETMRRNGYYEARAEAIPEFEEDGVHLTVVVRRGPRVRVVFTGDALTRAEQQRLVPIRAEASVDEDLLENASIDIERYLRERGYRDARASYARAQQDDELTITFDVMRGRRYVVGEVAFEGVTAFPTGELRALIPTERGDPFVESVIRAGVFAVDRAYRAQGYYRVEVTPAYQYAEPESAQAPVRADIRITLNEGLKYTIGSIEFAGNTVVADGELRMLIGMEVGSPLSGQTINEGVVLIESRYRDLGFENVRVDEPVLVLKEDMADLLFTITEGPQVFVDRIIIDGNERTSEAIIRGELLLQPGDPLGASERAESEARLRALGLFRRVRIEQQRAGSDDRVVLVVRVEEALRTTIGWGGGVEISERLRAVSEGVAPEERIEFVPRGFFEIGRRNMWGKNRSVNLFTRVSAKSRDRVLGPGNVETSYGINEYRVLSTFREPKVLGSPAELLVTGIAERNIRTSYSFVNREVRAEVGGRVAGGYDLSGRFSIRTTELFDVDPNLTEEQKPLVDRLFPQVRLSTVSGTLIRNTRINDADPEQGYFLNAFAEVAPRALGSEVGFVKTLAELSWYKRMPVRRRTVLALRGSLGAARGFRREVPATTPEGGVELVEDLPASERFFAGGSTTHRGFTVDRLGTLDTFTPSGFPTGGNAQILLNSEIRMALFGPVAGVAFLDLGNVFKRTAHVALDGLRPGVGGGLHYNSGLVGTVRAEVGFNLDRQELTAGRLERGYVLHISLGRAF